LLNRFPVGCAKIDALAIARAEPIYQGWGERSNVVDLRVAPPEVIVLQCAKAFIAEVDRLDELVRTASSL
jgi:hypothetical protein